jgi:hypothetical protein
MELDISGVKASSAVPDFVLDCSEFIIYYRTSHDVGIDTWMVESCVLRHKYLAAKDGGYLSSTANPTL